MNLSQEQREILDLPHGSKTFLEGPAGAGKTTAAAARLQSLLNSGIPGDTILVLLPQRTLSNIYQKAIMNSSTPPGGIVSILTAGGIARRMVELFWPLVSRDAGFSNPDDPPTFLTLETAQYFMAKLVNPLLDQGYFESVVIDRNRLFSQIIDNLNKAAVIGFHVAEIGDRLKAAWSGGPSQLRVFDDTQTCASLFRQTCLENNLLDFSLQVEIFWKYVWRLDICRNYLNQAYRHIIFDNLEEDSPFAHDLISQWLPNLYSALLIYDENAGYRRFLGADPDGAYNVKNLCTYRLAFSSSFVMSPSLVALNTQFDQAINHKPVIQTPENPRLALEFHTSRFYPQMIDWIAESTAALVNEQHIPPSEIVILTPYLSDALRYGIVHRLEQKAIPARSHRPSRSLREEPVTTALLTLARIAHPQWNLGVTKSDLAYALLQTIDGLDLVRSHLLAEIIFRSQNGIPNLESFDPIIPQAQERITYLAGERYEKLRLWLENYRKYPPLELDHFFSTLFGEILSQPGYRFHTSYAAGSITSRLIESIQKFRRVTTGFLNREAVPTGKEYIRMLEQGVIAAQYLGDWQPEETESVLIAPAYTYLISNYPVTAQFWLDIASRSWSERLSQPLTHPYILSRNWPRDRQWTDNDEIEVSQDALHRLVTGLLHRCRWKVFLGLTDLGEQCYEQRGPLLRAVNQIFRHYASQ